MVVVVVAEHQVSFSLSKEKKRNKATPKTNETERKQRERGAESNGE